MRPQQSRTTSMPVTGKVNNTIVAPGGHYAAQEPFVLKGKPLSGFDGWLGAVTNLRRSGSIRSGPKEEEQGAHDDP